MGLCNQPDRGVALRRGRGVGGQGQPGEGRMQAGQDKGRASTAMVDV